MKLKLVYKLRIAACILWLVGGLVQANLLGYMSAFASALFLLAIRIEIVGYDD